MLRSLFSQVQKSLAAQNSLQSLASRSLAPLLVPSHPRVAPSSLPSDAPIEEETLPEYNFKDFYPVHPRTVLHNRYEVIAKLGWGRFSTVWLAKDMMRWRWQSESYVAVKVNCCNYVDRDAATHELKMCQRLATGNPRHDGYRFMSVLLDSFEISGPHGQHICLVFEPMKMTLGLFQSNFGNNEWKIPLPLVKAIIRILLTGLDYIHSECKMVHTDLNPGDILFKFEESTVLDDFVRSLAWQPMARKPSCGSSTASPSATPFTHYTYLSQNDFQHIRASGFLPKIADFGSARPGDQMQTFPIQPDSYRAPEVLLGIGWSYSADIWNLGVMIWNLLEDRDLFTPRIRPRGIYSPAAHLAEMIALLGPPPQTLIMERATEARSWKWQVSVENPEGRLCERVEEYFGGPFWNYRNGEFLHEELIPSSFRFEDSLPSIADAEGKSRFLSFVRNMLRWVPEDRKTAKELLEDPWLLLK